MNAVEKRELFEQQRKIFEAGAQRANKRAGSFSFLTWPFFIAPLIAGEEFLAATFNSAAAEEHAKAALAGAAQQAANDDPPAIDPSKTSAEDETAKGPAASSEAHAAQFDPTGLLAQPQKDAPKPSTARSEEAVAAARVGAEAAAAEAAMMPIPAIMTLTPQSTIVPSTRCQRIPTSEAVNCRVGQRSNPFSPMYLSATRFSPSIIGSAPACLEASADLSNDVAGTIAPVEAAASRCSTTVTDTVGTLTDDVAGTIAPVVAAAQPVLDDRDRHRGHADR